MALWMVAAGWMVLRFAYHRWREHEEGPKRVDRDRQDVSIPRTDEGAPVPLVFGRCRVRAPMLVWTSDLEYTDVYVNADSGAFTQDTDDTPSHRVYALDMLFAIGIGMGSGTTRGDSLNGAKLHNVWLGDLKLPTSSAGFPSQEGANLYYGQNVNRETQYGGPGAGGGIRGAYYWFGGWTDQSFTTVASRVGDQIETWGGTRIPGLKRQMCVAFNRAVEDDSNDYFEITRPDTGGTTAAVPYPSKNFIFGESANVATPSFEVSTYGDKLNIVTGAHIFSMTNAGVDFGGGADPAEAIYCVMTDPLGKLNIDPSRIDTDSFSAASQTLKSENHGYSRVWESFVDGSEIIEDILAQTDGTLDEDPVTGTWRYKLIRPDYSVPDLLHITRDNCEALLNFKMSGHTGLINQVRVTYEDASDDYKEKSEIAKNPANAVGQDGQVNEVVLNMGGVKSAALARNIAGRELAARSVPIMSFRAVVGREFLRVMTGDAVKVTWSGPDIAGLVFRVANVERGTHENGKIALDLISDTFYVWRNQGPRPTSIGIANPPTTVFGG